MSATTCTTGKAHHWKVAPRVADDGTFPARCRRRGCGATRNYPSITPRGEAAAPHVHLSDVSTSYAVPRRAAGFATAATQALATAPLTTLTVYGVEG